MDFASNISAEEGKDYNFDIYRSPMVNNEFHQLCPFVSKDGKFLFFTSNQDIYWVDAKIIASYK